MSISIVQSQRSMQAQQYINVSKTLFSIKKGKMHRLSINKDMAKK